MGIYGCLVAIHGNEDPPGGPVDCTKRYPPRVAQCIRHGLLRWVRVVWRWWGVWLRSWILSRLRYFQTVCSVVAWQPAKIHAGLSRAWMAARIFGVGVAWLWSRTSIGVSRLNIPQHWSGQKKRITTRAMWTSGLEYIRKQDVLRVSCNL